jgi:hypothetical protein
MAEVLMFADVASRSLPPVCYRTGEPADDEVVVTFTRTPAWALVGLLEGMIGLLVVSALATRRVRVHLPATRGVARSVHRHRLGLLALLVAAPLVLLYVSVMHSEAPDLVLYVIMGACVAAVTLLTSFRYAVGVRGRLDRVGPGGNRQTMLALSGVHPAFVRALEAAGLAFSTSPGAGAAPTPNAP